MAEPEPVPAGWLAAKQAIAADPSYDGKAIDLAVNSVDPTQRKPFLQWLARAMKVDRTAQIVKETQQAPTSASTFVQAAQKVQFQDESSVSNFWSLSHPFDHRPDGEAILLGIENGNSYFFRLRALGPDVESDSKVTDPHPNIVRFRSIVGAALPLQYGLHVGVVCYTTPNDPTSALSTISPFNLYINPVDRSLWMVLARYYCDTSGELVEFEEQTDGWTLLPTTKGQRPPFDVIRLLSGDGVSRSRDDLVGREGLIFTTEALKYAQMCSLVPVDASKSLVARAVAGSGSGGAAAAA